MFRGTIYTYTGMEVLVYAVVKTIKFMKSMIHNITLLKCPLLNGITVNL
jgi:hypothetical protein